MNKLKLLLIHVVEFTTQKALEVRICKNILNVYSKNYNFQGVIDLNYKSIIYQIKFNVSAKILIL